jgi:Response regulator containing CheY-like receiver domain and AraC-type DNA-binding domain
VVDDEKWSIIDLLGSAAWDEEGFQVVGYYERSLEALERITSSPPDIVFTDVRMPGMDGIRLMQEARSAGVESEFVIISAFSDFSSAKKAIGLGVSDYCLKPVNPEALSALLRKLKLTLDKKAAPAEPPPQRPMPDSLARVVAYLGEHFREELSLDQTAARFNLNKNYLCQLFKKNLGETFSHYVASLRTGLAKDYLEKSSLALEEIAAKVGYEDYFYFCKVFKKIEGVSPGRYRRSGGAMPPPGEAEGGGA